MFYECKDGQPQLRHCSSGLYFSKSWGGCVDRQISDCPSPTPTPTPSPTTPSEDCRPGELLEHECNCTFFYECIYGRKALRECPYGQHFSSRRGTCVDGIDCEDPEPNCREGERSPHECQCRKYYICKNNQKAVYDCEKGTHFDNATLTCIPPEECNGRPRICENGDVKKHPCNTFCDRYYRCYNNDWLIEYCPNGEHFSEIDKRCMDPLEAGCDPNIKPPPGYCLESGPSKWPHECDCRLYYQCEYDRKKIYGCAWGYYFNRATLSCDVPSNVKNCVNAWDDWVR